MKVPYKSLKSNSVKCDSNVPFSKNGLYHFITYHLSFCFEDPSKTIFTLDVSQFSFITAQ